MTDHPVLIPTSEGPVGGIVSEPEDAPRAAMLLLPGYGRPARSGVNGFWTRTARALAGLGIVVLRVDHSREGETLPIGEGGSGQVWKHRLDLCLLKQTLSWFRCHTKGRPLLLGGVCSGARLAIDLAAREPDSVAGLFLIVPYLRDPVEADPGRPIALEVRDTVDPALVDDLRGSLDRHPVWLLAGEHDEEDVERLCDLLGRDAARLELEVAPGMALHFLDQPQLQHEVRARLIARVEVLLRSR